MSVHILNRRHLKVAPAVGSHVSQILPNQQAADIKKKMSTSASRKHHRTLASLRWRRTFIPEPPKQFFRLPGQRTEVWLTVSSAVHGGADPQVIQKKLQAGVQRRIPQVFAVFIQPRLDEGQQRTGGGGGKIMSAFTLRSRLKT